jgi:glycine cleavage system aminomethyltransferase T
MSQYGHEIEETTTLLEANLGKIGTANWDKGEFIGGPRAWPSKKQKVSN